MGSSVLIVDDDSNKRAAIKAVLRRAELKDLNIVEASDAAEARIALSRSYFDLMLLDVLLPSRTGAPPSGDVSIDFLRQIVEDETSPAPRHILGITAQLEALRDHEDSFRRMTTQILHVEVGSTAWAESLTLLLKRMQSELTKSHDFGFEVCVQTALRTPELQAVLETWGADWGPEKFLVRGVLVREGILKAGEKLLRVACAHSTQMGPLATAHLASALLHEYRPQILGMSGICGGIADGISIGDVVVAEKSWDWQSGKWTPDGDLSSAIDQKDGSADLVALTRGVDAEIPRIYADYSGEKPSTLPRLYVAPMVSGSAVVENKDIHSLFKAQHRKVGAVDMECYALYYQSIMSSVPPSKAICVKAVSDLARRGKADSFQRYGSYLSAQVLLATINRWANTAFEQR